MLDQIFGENNFQNEIVHRVNWAGEGTNNFCLTAKK